MRSTFVRWTFRIGLWSALFFVFLLLPLLVITSFEVQAADLIDLNTATAEQ